MRGFKNWRLVSSLALLLVSALLPLSVQAGNSGALWTVQFDDAYGPASASSVEMPMLMADASGKIFAYGFMEPGTYGTGLKRINPATGLPLWSAISPMDFAGHRPLQKLLMLANGESVLLAERLTRFRGSGSVAWSVPSSEITDIVPFSSDGLLAVVPVDDNAVVLRHIDASDGTVEEILVVDFVSCSFPKLAGDPGGGAYLACGNSGFLRIAANPLRSTWLVAGDVDGIEGSGNAFFEWRGNGLRKRLATDGSIIWEASLTSDGISGLVLHPDGDVFSFGESVERWNGTTGTRLWQADESGMVTLDPSGNAVYFAGNEVDPEPGPARAFIGRLNAIDGSLQWRSRTLPLSSNRITGLAATAGNVNAIGTTCAYPAHEACTLTIWSIIPTTGVIDPGVTLTTRAASVAVPSLEIEDRTLVAGLEWGSQGRSIRARTILNATGAVLEESTVPVPQPVSGHWPIAARLSVIRVSDGDIVATLGSDTALVRTEAIMMKFNPVSGEIAWQRQFLDDTVQGVAIGPPIAAAGGIVAVAIDEKSLNVDFHERWVRGFSIETGQELWQRGLISTFFSALPSLIALDGDVGSYEAPAGAAMTGFTRLSGKSGATVWINPDIGGSIIELDDGTALSTSSGTSARWQRFALDSGALLWTTIHAAPDSISTSIVSTVIDEGGDIYSGGSLRRVPFAPTTVRGFLIKLDRETGQIGWTRTLDENPVGPNSRVNPRFVRDGRIHATQPFAPASTHGYAMTMFAADGGATLGSTHLYTSSQEQPERPQLGDHGILGLNSSDAMIVVGESYFAGLPGTYDVSAWIIPGVATGELRVHLDVSPVWAYPLARHSFAFETRNGGTIPAESVDALLSIPRGAVIASLECEIGGMPCQAAATGTSVSATATIPPGQILRLAGEVQLPVAASQQSPGTFLARSFAAYPFVEADLKDNFATSREDRIFHGTFD